MFPAQVTLPSSYATYRRHFFGKKEFRLACDLFAERLRDIYIFRFISQAQLLFKMRLFLVFIPVLAFLGLGAGAGLLRHNDLMAAKKVEQGLR
jgi:hypothetical protein